MEPDLVLYVVILGQLRIIYMLLFPDDRTIR